MITEDENNIFKKTEKLFAELHSYFDESDVILTKDSVQFHYVTQIPEILSMCLGNGSFISEDKENDINIKQENLQAAELCLKIILLYLENMQTTGVKKSIVEISFNILYQSYIHCRDSESFYGELFEEFSNALGHFYNQVQEVQKIVLKTFDELINSGEYSTESETAEIVLISNNVGKLCDLVASLDRMTAIAFWKIFTKLIFKYRDILQKEIEIDDLLTTLLTVVKDTFIQCSYVIKMKEEVDESDIKMCIVDLNTLKKLVEVFKNKFKPIILLLMKDLALQFYDLVIQCHSFKTDGGNDLNVMKILLKTSKLVILNFFSDNNFFTSAFQSTTKEIREDLQLALVLLKLSAINYLKTSSEHSSLLQTGEVFNQMFSTLQANKADDDLKFISLKMPSFFDDETTKVQEDDCLYQHCYICLSECCRLASCFLGVIKASENHWLKIYKSSSNVVSLLISDVWIYYLRCGPVDDVFSMCLILSQDLRSLKENPRVKHLLFRMLKFLPTDYKIKLFDKEKHLHCIFHNYEVVDRFGSQQAIYILSEDYLLNEKVNTIIQDLNNLSSVNLDDLIQRVCHIFELCSICFDKLIPIEILQLIELSTLLFKSGVHDIQIATVSFLRILAGRTLSKNDKEIDVITSTVANLLCDMMKSEKYIIKYEAFNVYFSLALSTPHPQMVKKTVMKCPDLVPFIKSFAEKVPLHGFLKDEEKNEFQQQLLNYQLKETVPQHISEENKKMLFSILT